MFKRIINSIVHRFNIKRTRFYVIGQYRIMLPPGHMLDLYQERFKNYDKKLPAIAGLVELKYSAISIIDIGANIGDTAAALRNVCSAPIICIEGNKTYIPILESNISSIPGITRVIPKFIGLDVDDGLGELITINGTAHIDRQNQRGLIDSQLAEESFITYHQVLESNLDLPEVRLVKIDTDGFDFKIILRSINQLAKNKPIIFFEFDPSFSPKYEKDEALNAINALVYGGYAHYIIYDNFGNYLFSLSENVVEAFKDIYSFLHQSAESGGGSIVYFDVCCFSQSDEDIFRQLVKIERST